MSEIKKTSIIKSEKIKTSTSEVIYGSSGENAKPRVEVTRQDGKVKDFRIRCSCGEIVHLECQYND